MTTTTKKPTTIKDAVNRIQWRFSQGKSFLPNAADIESLNAITDALGNDAKKTVSANDVMAKLYVMLLREFVYKYRDMFTASEMLHDAIRTHSLSGRMQLLQTELNYAETNAFFEKLNLNPVWEVGQSINDIEPNRIKNREIFKTVDAKEAVSAMTAWDYETVEQSITADIYNLINKRQ